MIRLTMSVNFLSSVTVESAGYGLQLHDSSSFLYVPKSSFSQLRGDLIPRSLKHFANLRKLFQHFKHIFFWAVVLVFQSL